MASRHPSFEVEQIGDVTVVTITERRILDERVTRTDWETSCSGWWSTSASASSS